MLPDLSPGPCQWRDVAHLDHGFGELLEEELLVLRVLLNQRLRGLVLRHENFVGAQEPLVSQQVLEVVVVKLYRADEVQEKEVLVTPGLRAAGAELSGIGLVEREVGLPVASLVVEPLPEHGASCISNCVASCLIGHAKYDLISKYIQEPNSPKTYIFHRNRGPI